MKTKMLVYSHVVFHLDSPFFETSGLLLRFRRVDFCLA